MTLPLRTELAITETTGNLSNRGICGVFSRGCRLKQMPWWDAENHADRRPLLMLRGRIKERARAWFLGHGFTEVECAILQASPGNEAHLHAFATEAEPPDGSRHGLYLHTS